VLFFRRDQFLQDVFRHLETGAGEEEDISAELGQRKNQRVNGAAVLEVAPEGNL
jgi:hypothetical protein